MHQWLFDIPLYGGSVRTNHTLLLIAVFACCGMAVRELRVLQPTAWKRARWAWLILAMVPWLGGHLHFVLANWRYARTSAAVLFVPWNGIHAAGAIMALAVATPCVLRRYQLPIGRVADALLPTIGIGIMFARVGCFADGCCFGRPCDWPWCVAFPKASYAYELHLAEHRIGADAAWSMPVHPLQLYFAAVGLALCLFARWWMPRRRYEGQAALIGVTCFAFAATVLEPLRAPDDARVYWGPLPQLQWVALAMLGGAIGALWFVERSKPNVR